MRRYRKIGIEEERERLDKMAKKKSRSSFDKALQHTYEYDGSFMEFKKPKHIIGQQLIQEIRPNLLRNNSQRDDIKNKKLSNRNSLASTSMDYT